MFIGYPKRLISSVEHDEVSKSGWGSPRQVTHFQCSRVGWGKEPPLKCYYHPSYSLRLCNIHNTQYMFTVK